MTVRLHIIIRGAVQGVGFRPFVFRLASEMGLSGWVRNSGQGVFIEVEGKRAVTDLFLRRIGTEKPKNSFISSLEYSYLDVVGYNKFEILDSELTDFKNAVILPDISVCPDCLRELFDPSDRRYLYPFINCTNCGPRFTIIASLPYDRTNTTMADFTMCYECKREYEDPTNRRFHAQPNACPECGPQVELLNNKGEVISRRYEAIKSAADFVKRGNIIALKGIGGFHLIADAQSNKALELLRKRKLREEKPFAVMADSIETAEQLCEISELERDILLSPESPIVLLKKRRGNGLSPLVSPNNPYFGIMLPYTPLHHLLIRELAFPVVATSGNRTDEPICIDEVDALERLSEIADFFLVHNRRIARHVDDSIVKIVGNRPMIIRRSRGYAPLPFLLRDKLEQHPPILSVGAHLKTTVSLVIDNSIFVSQHVGDLDTMEARNVFKRSCTDLQELYEVKAEIVVHDAHPDYSSTAYAQKLGKPMVAVQHHIAHVASCMAENEVKGPLLGVAWDGTGYGYDGTIWGGEFFVVNGGVFERYATFRKFPLPGGEVAIREPRRAALGVLFEMFGGEISELVDRKILNKFSSNELSTLLSMLRGRVNSPLTSSAGRLFDAAASISGVRDVSRFEGQSAMEFEYAIEGETFEDFYPYAVNESAFNAVGDFTNPSYVIDWGGIVSGLLNDVYKMVPVKYISAKFHNAMAQVIVEIARRAGIEKVILSGGCFQNKYLSERAINILTEDGFQPYWHQRIPPNDGGISLGQAYIALTEMQPIADGKSRWISCSSRKTAHEIR
ncbi:MAG: carbamoyltransferase HypF [Candidatus Kryptoniota bacterium]